MKAPHNIETPTVIFLLHIVLIFCLAKPVAAQPSPAELPLFSIESLDYAGAFRLPAATFGASSLNYSEGPIAYNPLRHSLYIVGHSHHQAVAEFAIPALIKSASTTDLIMAEAPLQTFATLLDRIPGGNPQDINRIGGMACFPTADGMEMLINGYEYYDAPADNSHATFVVRDAGDLDGSALDGFFSFEGGAGHTSGWLSPVPDVWQPLLGGSYITGQSSGIPIIGRTSVGPSAFAFDPMKIVGKPPSSETIATTKLLDFSLDTPLHSDLSNDTGTNGLWTHLSRAVYGFIVPGTRTYFTLGYSGGHASGVCYKCTQSDGNVCGGYCAPDANDYAQYFWLWDVNDLIAVKEGQRAAHEMSPYAYGPFSTPFEGSAHQLGGAAFDPASGLLYITVQRADREQGTYANPPVVVAYQVVEGSQPVSNEDLPELASETGLSISSPYPNPFHASSQFSFRSDALQRVKIIMHDLLGREVSVLKEGLVEADRRYTLTIKADGLPAGIYLLQFVSPHSRVTRKVVRL